MLLSTFSINVVAISPTNDSALTSAEIDSIMTASHEEAIQLFNASGQVTYNPETDYIFTLYLYEVGEAADGTILYRTSTVPIARRADHMLHIMMDYKYGRTYQPWAVVSVVVENVFYVEATLDLGDGTRSWKYEDYGNNGVKYAYLYYENHTYLSAGEYETTLISGSGEIGPAYDDYMNVSLYDNPYPLTITVT